MSTPTEAIFPTHKAACEEIDRLVVDLDATLLQCRTAEALNSDLHQQHAVITNALKEGPVALLLEAILTPLEPAQLEEVRALGGIADLSKITDWFRLQRRLQEKLGKVPAIDYQTGKLLPIPGQKLGVQPCFACGTPLKEARLSKDGQPTVVNGTEASPVYCSVACLPEMAKGPFTSMVTP